MPRVPRYLSVLPNHPHHLILRGNNRRRLFSYPRERRFFLSRLVESSDKHEVPVHVSMLMSNHVHLVVTPSNHRQLARFVSFFAQGYAQFRNRSRAASGKLFEQRYRCIPIVNEEQLAVTTVYIELNPVRAGICTDAAAYSWSSHRQHIGLEAHERLVASSWTPSPWYLSLGSHAEQRAAVFCDWFAYYRERDEWNQVYRGPSRSPDRKRFERPDRKSAT